MSLRGIRSVRESKPAIEVAGVRLRRGFGFGEEDGFDPFLLFDDFRGERPDDYRAGFPWHPHRGIETITYVLAGSVEYRDSLGKRGVMTAGELQWMTAGRGIVHQEMPEGDGSGRMHGFQLWANLPAAGGASWCGGRLPTFGAPSSSRRGPCGPRPLTPPYVRFRIRRFMKCSGTQAFWCTGREVQASRRF